MLGLELKQLPGIPWCLCSRVGDVGGAWAWGERSGGVGVCLRVDRRDGSVSR